MWKHENEHDSDQGMNKAELTRIALVVGLSILVVVIATSDISALYNPE